MSQRQRILVVTAGLNRNPGAANSYQEALMEALAAQGHAVASVAMAETRIRPGVSFDYRPGPIGHYRIYNGGVYPAIYGQGGVGTINPTRDQAASPALDAALRTIVDRERPTLVSVQSFFGLPFSCLQTLRASGARVVFTAHDYFPLCTTAHLFRPEGSRCSRSVAELDCARCCEGTLPYRTFWLSAQLERVARNSPWPRPFYGLRNLLVRFVRKRRNAGANHEPYRERVRAAGAALRSLDAIQAISTVQAEELVRIAGPLPHLRILPVVPPSLRDRTPRLRPSGPRPLRVVALNVNGDYKGAGLIRQLVRSLDEGRVPYELHLHGPNHLSLGSPQVREHGRYHARDLERIAAGADLCLVPSVWSETLGFVGLEMMARGVPLIVSRQAGVSEWVTDGVNGLTFDATRPADLTALITALVNSPARVDSLNVALANELSGRRPSAARKLQTFPEHLSDLERFWTEVMA